MVIKLPTYARVVWGIVRDPRTQYVPMQAKIASQELLAEYLVHTGSGLYAIPPGVSENGYWAQSLLEA